MKQEEKQEVSEREFDKLTPEEQEEIIEKMEEVIKEITEQKPA